MARLREQPAGRARRADGRRRRTCAAARAGCRPPTACATAWRGRDRVRAGGGPAERDGAEDQVLPGGGGPGRRAVRAGRRTGRTASEVLEALKSDFAVAAGI